MGGVHTNYPGILLKCWLGFSRSGVGSESLPLVQWSHLEQQGHRLKLQWPQIIPICFGNIFILKPDHGFFLKFVSYIVKSHCSLPRWRGRALEGAVYIHKPALTWHRFIQYRYTSLYWASRMLQFLQIYSKALLQQTDYNSLYYDDWEPNPQYLHGVPVLTMTWNRARPISCFKTIPLSSHLDNGWHSLPDSYKSRRLTAWPASLSAYPSFSVRFIISNHTGSKAVETSSSGCDGEIKVLVWLYKGLV